MSAAAGGGGGGALSPRLEEVERALPRGMEDGAGRFTGLFVRRPVLAVVVNLLVIVAGLAALMAVEVRELPDIDRPVVTITTEHPGAAPEAIDAEITDLIEGAAARVPGVVSIESQSRFGRSRVTVEFATSVDVATAAGDLRDAVARIRDELPADAGDPQIVKADADASPVMRLSLISETLPVTELTRIARDLVADRLAAIEGVADVQLRGERGEVLYVDIDQAALASRGFDIADVARLVGSVASERPAGRIESATQEIVIRTDSGVRSAEAFAALKLDATTRLGDVAAIRFGPEPGTTVSRADGLPRVGLDILRQAGANTLDISDAVRAEVARLAPLLPQGVRLVVSSDDAIFVRGAIAEVVAAIGLAIAIVVAIILLFLGNLRATLIPALTMPVALIGTIAGIWLCGFSINILTLLALVMATGLVVDDAIVVLENVMRRRAMGLGPRAAALVGVREVFFAVIATTATLAAVFVPISFLPGQAGGLFREFGFVLAISVAISSAVTLTLVPILAARLPAAAEGAPMRQGIARRLAGALGAALAGLYARLLRAALSAPLVAVTLAAIAAGAALPVYLDLPREVTPREDRGLVLISVSTPQGVSLAHTDAQLRRIEAILRAYTESGEAATLFSFAGWGGANNGFVVLRLADWSERARSQQEIVAEIAGRLAALPGVRAFPIQPNSLGIRGGGRGLQIALAGPDFREVAALARALVDRLSQDPRFGQVRLSADLDQPQLTVAIDPVRAADLGIAVDGLSQAIQSVLDGREIARLNLPGRVVPIRLVSTGTPIDDPTDLENVFLHTAEGRIVPMSAIATLRESAAPASLNRVERMPAVGITATLADGVALQQALAEAGRIAAPMLPQGVRLIPLAEAAALGETGRGLGTVFLVAIAVVVLVLAAQFESFLAAVIIILTVPLGLACAVFAMAISGVSLNVYSQIGLVLLVGVMAKNGILIVEFANQLRERGLALGAAIEAASRIRLRPVAMTAISTVLGGLPLILTSGPGAEARIALGWVVVGGLGLATLATLFVTPVAYLLLARFTRPRVEEEARLSRELARARLGLHGRA